MDHLKGSGYNAVGVESAFDIFMQQRAGPRGSPHDADVFRSGNLKAIGEVIELIAEHFERRSTRIQFATSGDGTPEARIHSEIQSLRLIALDMKASRAKEPEDYH